MLTVTHISGLLQQVDLYDATVNDADIAQMMEFYYNESTCFIRPDHARNGWCSQSKDGIPKVCLILIYMYIFQM